MLSTTVTSAPVNSKIDLRVVLAFFAIYVLWGTTFLAIRIVVQDVPPLSAAGVRFLIAGVSLYIFMRVKGQARPIFVEWRSLGIIGFLMFVAEYGALFWAEKYVPSGIASVLEATLPLIAITLNVCFQAAAISLAVGIRHSYRVLRSGRAASAKWSAKSDNTSPRGDFRRRCRLGVGLGTQPIFTFAGIEGTNGRSGDDAGRWDAADFIGGVR